MHPTTNPAARLAALLAEARRNGAPAHPAMNTWVTVFKLGKVPEVDRQFDVMRLLAEMHEQLRDVERRAAATIFRPANYVPQLKSIAQALLPNRLYEQWQNSLNFLTTDALLALNLLADVIGEDEAPLPGDKIEALLVEIAALENEVRDSDLNADLKRFVYVQLDSIRSALRSYPIVGAVALQRAFRTAVWQWQDDPMGRQADPRANAVFARVGRIIKVVATFAAAAGATVTGTEKALNAAHSIISEVPAIAAELGLDLPPGTVVKQLSAPAEPDYEVEVDVAPDL